jgi:hypothetical protein
MFLKIVLVVLLLIYALFLVAIFDFRKLRSKGWIITFVLGIASFASVFIVQVPVQRLMGSSVFFYNLSDIWKAILYAAVAGFVQEFFKAVAAFYHKGDSFSGAVSGAGFGFIEVVFIFLSAPAISFIAVLERIFTVMFHISSTELVMYGKGKRKFALSYIAMSLVHTFIDTFAVLFQMHYSTLYFTEIAVAAVSVILFVVAIYLYKMKLLQRAYI